MLGVFKFYGNTETAQRVLGLIPPAAELHPNEIPSYLLSTLIESDPDTRVVESGGSDFLFYGLHVMSVDVVVKDGLYIIYKGDLDIHHLISFYEEIKKKGKFVIGKQEVLPGKYKVILYDQIGRKVLVINTMQKGTHFRYGFSSDGHFVVSDVIEITRLPWINFQYMSRGYGILAPLDDARLLGVFPFGRPFGDTDAVAADFTLTPSYTYLKSFTSIYKIGYCSISGWHLATLAHENSGAFYASKGTCHFMWQVKEQANKFEDLFADLFDAFVKLKENKKTMRDPLRLDGGWAPFPLKKKWIRGKVKLNCIVYDEFVSRGEVMRCVFACTGLHKPLYFGKDGSGYCIVSDAEGLMIRVCGEHYMKIPKGHAIHINLKNEPA